MRFLSPLILENDERLHSRNRIFPQRAALYTASSPQSFPGGPPLFCHVAAFFCSHAQLVLHAAANVNIM